jgi:dTMP kinase
MNGKLFVIEGLDGSGKQTQTNLLYERLHVQGVNIRKVEYPNYASDSSALVKMYLRGDFGADPDTVSPYISATFFAADRYATYKTGLEDFYRSGGIILSDRYTTSNMMHQASKIGDAREKEKFLDWLWDFEYNIYQTC